ncbi:MAG: 16S rRNA (cytidine(1402)-2'-O)-methyltransferase [Patescibacteria group bacterium]|nr:16S rRNA (cytidine(1402)-2'-O)-methyltransferase [Patescibacteria group bacterium]
MGKLYVVGTPIGNLGDITLRALETLKNVDYIACEDTRITIKLLNHFDIKKPLISYYQHSKLSKIDYLIGLLKEGKDIALVTDAGTPGISDPGGVLIAEAVKNNIKIIPNPGPNAAISALSISGFPTDEFLFLGFLPKKKGRQTLLNSLRNEKRTIAFYESPERIKRTLNDLLEFLGDRGVVVCRELTKMFEEIYRGKVSQVLPKIKEKGEFVVVLSARHSRAGGNLGVAKLDPRIKPEDDKGEAND